MLPCGAAGEEDDAEEGNDEADGEEDDLYCGSHIFEFVEEYSPKDSTWGGGEEDGEAVL